MFPLHDDKPIESTPFVTISVIVICIWVWLWQLTLGEEGFQRAAYAFGLVPAVLTGKAVLPAHLDLVIAPATMLTGMFLHGGLLHIAGNLLYLWVFGNNVEDAMGHRRFLAFFLFCGAFAALAQTVQDPVSTVPMIGASGAVSGVLGAYLLLHPRASVLVMVPLGFILYPLRLSAGVLIVLWFAVQIVSSVLADPAAPGVAWHAHIGGFVAGALLLPFLKRRNVALFA